MPEYVAPRSSLSSASRMRSSSQPAGGSSFADPGLYALYLYDFSFNKEGRTGTVLIAFALLVFFAIGFIFTKNMTLMLDPTKWTAFFQNDSGTVLNLGDQTLALRYLHFMTGILAVDGLTVAVFGKLKERRDTELAAVAIRLGMKTFAWLTLLQLLLGSWFFLSLPGSVIGMFLGGDALATDGHVKTATAVKTVEISGFLRTGVIRKACNLSSAAGVAT